MRRPTTAREVTLEFPIALRAGPKETEAENAQRASIRMAKFDMAKADFKKIRVSIAPAEALSHY